MYINVSTFRRICGFYKSVMVWYHFTSFVSSILSKGFTASRLIACTPQQEFVTVYRPWSYSTKIYISSSARTVSFVFFFQSVQRSLPNLTAHSYVPSHPDGGQTEINNTYRDRYTAKFINRICSFGQLGQ